MVRVQLEVRLPASGTGTATGVEQSALVGLTLEGAPDTKMLVSKVNLPDYRALAQFRYEIRKFLAFSESAAREAGIEPQQHQALLAVKGMPPSIEPTIGALAERLCVQHHTAVALVDKLEQHGWAKRQRASTDRRQVLLTLTPKGGALLAKLSAMHRDQLGTVGSAMVQALEVIVNAQAERGPKRR